MVSCGVRLSVLGFVEIRKPQVKFLSRLNNSFNFKAQKWYQRLLDPCVGGVDWSCHKSERTEQAGNFRWCRVPKAFEVTPRSKLYCNVIVRSVRGEWNV